MIWVNVTSFSAEYSPCVWTKIPGGGGIDVPGMCGNRSRNQEGHLRDKRDDTHIATVEAQYGIDLGVRGDTHLGNYLQREGLKSLNDLVHDRQRRD